MKKGFGFFSTYEIEDVYFFLGKKRIDNRINDLKNKPSMGMRLEEFIIKDSHIVCRGTLFIFSMLLNWFKETDIILHLYNKSKDYNEQNYFENKKMSKIWQECKESTTRLIKSSPDMKDHWRNQSINPFWIDYHFFISSVVNELMKFKKYEADKKIEQVLDEIFNFYFSKAETITARIKQDVSLWSDNELANLVFSKMQTFYKSRNELDMAYEITQKRNLLGWR